MFILKCTYLYEETPEFMGPWIYKECEFLWNEENWYSWYITGVTSKCNSTGDYSTNFSCYILLISSLLGDIVLHGIVASLPGMVI